MLRSRGNDLRLDEGLEYTVFPGRGHMKFAADPIRLWEVPVEAFLEGGMGLLPLAPLAAMPRGLTREEAMPEVLRQIEARLKAEPSFERTNQLLNWTYTLAGLHFGGEVIEELFTRNTTMLSEILQKSQTHQYTLQKGRLDHARKSLLELGADKFGVANDTVRSRITAITDLERFDRMIRAVLRTNSWNEVIEFRQRMWEQTDTLTPTWLTVEANVTR